ncbi:MAG: hypothetical protein BMS9Abin12_1327 [Acidimicrobiia bacterium]|nr:MAG: hypothetical protein BMS9Abin12_1327 [Acidimicrobiia bacterium]
MHKATPAKSVRTEFPIGRSIVRVFVGETANEKTVGESAERGSTHAK